MRRLAAFGAIAALLAQGASPARAETFLAPRARDVRRLNIVRLYEIPVTKGQKTVAGVPAMMSFWGATNQQVILDSKFDYSLQPDRIEVTADDLGMLRRNYELTWSDPQVDVIRVRQTMMVELACQGTLVTAARLPYPKEVQDRFASSLAATKSVNCDNPKVRAIGEAVGKKAQYAEDAAELVCDWVEDNVAFQKGSPGESDTVLGSGKGNCGGMSNLACAILRSMGIPAEPVSAAFVGGGGHAFLEAYFLDAGWVFYDVSNGTRGYKSLDCLVTAGFSFRVEDSRAFKWHEGHFCEAKDAFPYEENPPLSGPPLRSGPQKNKVLGAKVLHRPTPPEVKVRHQPICALIQDLTIPPGKREYARPQVEPTPQKAADASPQKTPAPAAATRPAPEARAKPESRPEEPPAAKRLKVARMYLNGGLTDKAEAILRQVIRESPDSREAEEARKLLKDMGKRE